MARTDNLTNFLTDVADSIRAKKGTTDPITAADFDSEIASIVADGGIKSFSSVEEMNSSQGTDGELAVVYGPKRVIPKIGDKTNKIIYRHIVKIEESRIGGTQQFGAFDADGVYWVMLTIIDYDQPSHFNLGFAEEVNDFTYTITQEDGYVIYTLNNHSEDVEFVSDLELQVLDETGGVTGENNITNDFYLIEKDAYQGTYIYNNGSWEEADDGTEEDRAADISEYFNDTLICDGNSNGSWLNLIKKLPPLKNNSTNLAYAFKSFPGTSLDLSNFNTDNVNRMDYMFSNCKNLIDLDLSNFNTSRVSNVQYMFSYSLIKTLNITNFDASTFRNIYSIFNFSDGNYLEHIYGSLKNLGKGYTQTSALNSNCTLALNTMALIPHDEVMNFINDLYDLNLTYDVANGGTLYTQKLTLGSANMAKLTAEEIAIATNKGWTVS